jgi:hypothetical protein
MAGEDDDSFSGQRGEQIAEAVARFDVQSGRWLVDNEQRRSPRRARAMPMR